MPKRQKIPPHRVRAGRKVTLHVWELAPGNYDATVEGSATLGALMRRALLAGLGVVSGQPANPPWDPLERFEPSAESLVEPRPEGVEHWHNSLYVVEMRRFDGGLTHLSIKRTDKTPVRMWRHLQAVKNQLCGPEREAIELFPAESRLVDEADQFHLWVFPEGVRLPIGYEEREVKTPEENEAWGRKRGVVVDQTPWPEGLPTGPNL